jgi:hypothetical protein
MCECRCSVQIAVARNSDIELYAQQHHLLYTVLLTRGIE